MSSAFPDITQFNEHCILIRFGREIHEDLLDDILTAKEKIQNNKLKVELDVVSTYTSLLVIYPVAIKDFYSEKHWLKKLLNQHNLRKIPLPQEFQFPVCYDPEMAPDLELISQQKNMSVNEIIKVHSTTIYRVYMIGFLPGFLYLGGLDKQLEMPRKKEPRKKIDPGSVGIGGLQTGIYPRVSPGGWQIIGRCPLSFFDMHRNPPMQINPGDIVRFYSISVKEYHELKAAQPEPLLFKN